MGRQLGIELRCQLVRFQCEGRDPLDAAQFRDSAAYRWYRQHIGELVPANTKGQHLRVKLDVSLHMAPVRRVRRAQAGNLDGSNVFLRGTSPKRHHAKWFARAGTSLNGLSGLDRDQGFLRRFDGMLQEYGARSDKGFDLAGKRLQGFTLALERWQAALYEAGLSRPRRSLQAHGQALEPVPQGAGGCVRHQAHPVSRSEGQASDPELRSLLFPACRPELGAIGPHRPPVAALHSRGRAET